LDVDEEIVKQAKFIGIHVIRKSELKTGCTRLLKLACMIKVHHHGDGNKPPTNEPPAEFQDIIMEFLSLVGEPTYANSEKER
jgi:hypothetical protein